MKSCFFIGHREISEEIFSAITEAVEHHIVHCGVTEVLTAWLQGLLSQQRLCIRELLCCFCSPIIRQSDPLKHHPGLMVLSTHRAWNLFSAGTLS